MLHCLYYFAIIWAFVSYYLAFLSFIYETLGRRRLVDGRGIEGAAASPHRGFFLRTARYFLIHMIFFAALPDSNLVL